MVLGLKGPEDVEVIENPMYASPLLYFLIDTILFNPQESTANTFYVE